MYTLTTTTLQPHHKVETTAFESFSDVCNWMHRCGYDWHTLTLDEYVAHSGYASIAEALESEDDTYIRIFAEAKEICDKYGSLTEIGYPADSEMFPPMSEDDVLQKIISRLNEAQANTRRYELTKNEE